MIIKRIESYSSSHHLLIKCLLIIVLIEYSNGGNGFVIIPKKVDQNQTRIIDREKSSTVTAASLVPVVGNYSVPNSISDTNNKNSRSSTKNSMISSSNSKITTQRGSQVATATTSKTSSFAGSSSNSSNQLGEHANDTQLLTSFSTTNFTNITAQVGSIVELPCTVHHLTEGTTVSWIRKREYHLLTVGLTTYSSDERFSALHTEDSEDWPLKIKYVQLRDEGEYVCQVTKHPPMSVFVQLNVVEAKAEISGPSEKYLKPGSLLRLTCRIVENIENPLYIFWYHNSRMINYDTHRGVNVTTEPDNKYSELHISQTTPIHSGNYSCVANNAVSSSTFVHIFNGENPAELLRDQGPAITPSPSSTVLSLLLSLVTYQLIFCFWS